MWNLMLVALLGAPVAWGEEPSDEAGADEEAVEEAPAEEEPAPAAPVDQEPEPVEPPPPPPPPPVPEPPAAPEAPEPPEQPPEPPREGLGDRVDQPVYSGGFVAYGGLQGMYFGGTLGWLAGDEAGAIGGSLLGGLAGAAALSVMSAEMHPDDDQLAMLATSSAVGAWTGFQLARTFIPPGDSGEASRIAVSGLLGNMAGTGLAVATLADAPPGTRTVNAGLATVVGWQAAAGFSDLAGLDPHDHRRIRAPITLAAGLGAGAATVGLGAAGMEPVSPQLLVVSAGHGAWLGLWVPFLFDSNPDKSQVWGGLRLGVASGYLGAVALSPFVETTAWSSTWQVVGIGAGSAIGAGLPMALGVDPNRSHPATIVGPLMVGSVAGQVYGALLATHYEPSPEDAVLAGFLGAWTAWQSVGWGTYAARLANRPTHRSTGYALTTAGVGALTTLTLPRVVDVSTQGSASIAAAGMWGTWYGGWGGHLLRLHGDQHWLLTLGLGNGALVGSAVVLAGAGDPRWETVALINGLGAIGGASGALFGVVMSPEMDAVATGGLLGSTGGLVAGVVMASRRRGEATGAGGLHLPHVVRLPVRPRVTVGPWMGEDGSPGVYGQVLATGW